MSHAVTSNAGLMSTPVNRAFGRADGLNEEVVFVLFL
jgi:hypothetical protein